MWVLVGLTCWTCAGSWAGLLLRFTAQEWVLGAGCRIVWLFEWKHSFQRWVIVGVIVRVKLDSNSYLILTITPTITHLWSECFHSNNCMNQHSAPTKRHFHVHGNNNPPQEPTWVKSDKCNNRMPSTVGLQMYSLTDWTWAYVFRGLPSYMYILNVYI